MQGIRPGLKTYHLPSYITGEIIYSSIANTKLLGAKGGQTKLMFSRVLGECFIKCVGTRKGNARNEPIWGKIGVVPIKDKMLLELLWPC